MKNGICLLCFGNQSFGELTYNLIVSIKKYSDVPITVFTDYDSLKSVDINIFDDLRVIPNDILYINNKSHANRFKLCLHELSPYDNTMYLDVDSLYMLDRPIDCLFDLLTEEIDIIGQNERNVDMNITSKIFHGYDVSTFKPAFNFINKKLYQMHGQFLLFKKNDTTKKFFELSKQIYDNMENGSLINNNVWLWFGRPIEELAMTVATGLIDIKILEKFAPVSVQNENMEYEDILKQKYFISICGSSTNEIATKIGGYCQDESYTKKYISHYNRRILELNNRNCKQYIEKIYNI